MKKIEPVPSAPVRGVRRKEGPVGAYDADRGAKLQFSAAKARAELLIAGIEAHGVEGSLALDRAFPGEKRKARDARGRRADPHAIERVRSDGGAVVTQRDREMAELDHAQLAIAAARSPTMMGRLERVAKGLGVVVDVKAAKKARVAKRRADALGAAAVDAAVKNGASLPNAELAAKRSWRVEVVDTPEGSIAKPAFVVRIEANSPIGRLSRSARPGDRPALSAGHVRAASEVCALYFASMKGARLVGSYDGVLVDTGGAGRAHPIDVACAAWVKLDGALKKLLPVEHRVVMEVCVYETPIEQLARAGIVHFAKLDKAQGAIVQTLCCGLARLAQHWGIDLGAPHES